MGVSPHAPEIDQANIDSFSNCIQVTVVTETRPEGFPSMTDG